MSVNFYTTNGYRNYPQLQKDVNDVKDKVEKVDSLDSKVGKSVFGSLPPVRRIMSLPDKIENGEAVAGLGLASLMVMNLPEDWRDIKAGYKQAKAKLTNQPYKPSYLHGQYQHDFSFFKGTLVDDWVKNLKDPKAKQTALNWYNMDKSLYYSKFGQSVKKFIGITDGKAVKTPIIDRFGKEMFVSEVKAGSHFAELTGRAMKRLPILSIAALALLELPKIFKSTEKGDNIAEQAGNTVKQTAKSAVNVTSVLAGVGYGGAIGAKKFGAIGSLVGMGVGAVIGATASSKLQDVIA